jgi:putative membrane protein
VTYLDLFLALGTFAGLALVLMGHDRAGMTLLYWNCLFMLGAAIVLAGSAPGKRRGALVQGAAPLLFVLLAAVRWAT